MKKIVVGLSVACFLLIFQMVTVYGSSFPFQEKLDGMVSSVENFFIEQKGFISNIFEKQQADQYKKADQDLAMIIEEVLDTTTNDVKAYKRSYLLNLTEGEKDTLVSEQFVAYSNKKNKEIESEINGDITNYLAELLEQDKKQMNRKGD